MAADASWLTEHIRDIPDFPRTGVIFKDITPLLGDPDAFRFAVDAIADHFAGVDVDRVIGIEARGFILAAPVAYRRGASFVPVRKAGKLPWAVAREEYALEYGTDKLEIHRDAVMPGERVLVVDDVLATGGTATAAVRLVEGLGGVVVGLGFLIELAVLSGRDSLRATRSTASSRLGELEERAMATVDRVLPWRRHAPLPADEVAPLVAAYRQRHPKAPIGTIVRAYELAAEAHEHQYRKTGETYINHPLSVAKIVADIGLDDTTIAAALLHDAVEDTDVTLAELEERVRHRGRRDRRRGHQARPDPLRLQGGAAGRDHAQDAGGDGQGPPGPDHQAGRPAPQHAHARRPAARASSSASRRRPSTSTRRWPTASACRR